MNATLKTTLVAGALALTASPALASSTPPSNQGTANIPSTVTAPSNQGTSHSQSTPGPHASLPAKAKAYGKYCQGESKQHSAGEHGNPNDENDEKRAAH